MIQSRVFVLFSFALCLVACVCAHTNSAGTIKNEKDKEAETAVKAHGDSWKYADKALKNIKKSLRDAKKIPQRLEAHKKNGEYAKNEAEQKAKGNAEAEAVAKEAKSAMEEFNKLYPNVKSAAEVAVTNITQLLNTAEALRKEVNADVFSDADSLNDYKEIIKKCSAFEARATALEKINTERAKILKYPGQLVWNMSALMVKAQMAMYKVFVIVSRTEIETVLNKTDIHIRSAEQRRSEVNATVNEIEKLSKTAPKNLSAYCSAVINNGNGYLRSASRAVDEVKEVKKEILQLKHYTSDILKNIKNTTDTDNAFYKARRAKHYAEKVAKHFPEITRAARFAEISVTNANSTKESFKRTLSKSKGEAVNEDNEATDKVKTLFYNTKEVSENGSRVGQTLLNSETVIEASEDSMQQASNEPTVEEEEEQLKDKRSEIIKDKLRKRYKNVTGIQHDDGKFAAWSEWSDRSITLSLPLLAALIASVVLH